MKRVRWQYRMSLTAANAVANVNVVPIALGECIVEAETETAALFMARSKAGWAGKIVQCDLSETLERLDPGEPTPSEMFAEWRDMMARLAAPGLGLDPKAVPPT